MREAGNEAFVAGDDDLAMLCYNKVSQKIRRKKRANQITALANGGSHSTSENT